MPSWLHSSRFYREVWGIERSEIVPYLDEMGREADFFAPVGRYEMTNKRQYLAFAFRLANAPDLLHALR